MALSGIAMQHADNGYSRGENLDSSLVRNMVVIYSPHGTNFYGSRGGEFKRTE